MKRRTKRKLLVVGLIFTFVFLVVIAGASARSWNGGWLAYPPLSWFF